MNDSQQEFEKWAEAAGMLLKRYGGKEFNLSYANCYTDEHWRMWQAAWQASEKAVLLRMATNCAARAEAFAHPGTEDVMMALRGLSAEFRAEAEKL
jgi:hypothetical protein